MITNVAMKNRYIAPAVYVHTLSKVVMAAVSPTIQFDDDKEKLPANQVESKESSPFLSFWEDEEEY